MGESRARTKYLRKVKIDPQQVEDAAKELYIRALKRLPPDIKAGFTGLAARETDATAQNVLGTMIRNITVAEDTDNQIGRASCRERVVASV